MIIRINKQTQGSMKWSENHYYIKLFTVILGMFTNVVAKWPGNAHDSFIFQDSLIYDKLNDELKDLEDGFLIGDSGYGCKPFIMTPYPHPSTQHQEAFNEALGKTRVKSNSHLESSREDSISCTLKYAWIPSKFRSS